MSSPFTAAAPPNASDAGGRAAASATVHRLRPDVPRDRPTAPPVQRLPMRGTPWFGFLRGLLLALLPGLRFGCALPEAPWSAAARRRRAVLLTGVLAAAVTAAMLQAGTAPAEPGPAWWLQAALSVLLLAWLAAGAMTALMGAHVMLFGDRHALIRRLPEGERLGDRAPLSSRSARRGQGRPREAPLSKSARTAVIMPICNEDVDAVFAALEATCESTAATGALPLFDFFILSDTSDPARRAAELRAWQRLRLRLGDGEVGAGGRIFYRWRRRRKQRKAGNVADFCRRWGARYRYMIVLDADSTMAGDTLVSLVRLMEQSPQAGIIQTLPQGAGAMTLHARAQQFAQRVSGRLFALGMAYWQLGEAHYWGHNAILRIEPFMKHCALAPLPGRGGLAGDIMSHDFVEAALMGRAGYEVWLVPELAGSWEQYPPHLLDELQRDRRWCQGNLQNARLVAEPGWRGAHRAMFLVGALSYAVAPLWLLFVAAGLLEGPPAADAAATASLAVLGVLTLAMLLAPRVLGVAAVLLARQQRGFGGSLRLLAGALAELLLSAVQAPLRLLAHTGFVVGALSGLKLEWRSPLRQAERVRWREAFARVGVLIAPALLLLTAALAALWPFAAAKTSMAASPQTALRWALVFVPLLLAVPWISAGTHPGLSGRLRRRGWFAVPEEHAPPRPLQSAADKLGLARSAPPAPPRPANVHPLPLKPARAAQPSWRPALASLRSISGPRPVAWALAASVAAAVAFVPMPGHTPDLPVALRAQAERFAALQLPRAAESGMQVAIIDFAGREPPRRQVRERPARMIDNAVRRRALDYVRRALAEEAEDPMSLTRIWNAQEGARA